MADIYGSLVEIVGEDHVSTEAEELYLYARDAGLMPAGKPDYIVAPKTTEEIQNIVLLANEKKILAVMLTAHALSLKNTVKSFKKGAAYFIPKEEMANIAIFLNDVLEGERGEKSFWRKWLDRLGEFYDKRFGSDWMKQDRDFWEDIKQK